MLAHLNDVRLPAPSSPGQRDGATAERARSLIVRNIAERVVSTVEKNHAVGEGAALALVLEPEAEAPMAPIKTAHISKTFKTLSQHKDAVIVHLAAGEPVSWVVSCEKLNIKLHVNWTTALAEGALLDEDELPSLESGMHGAYTVVASAPVRQTADSKSKTTGELSAGDSIHVVETTLRASGDVWLRFESFEKPFRNLLETVHGGWTRLFAQAPPHKPVLAKVVVPTILVGEQEVRKIPNRVIDSCDFIGPTMRGGFTATTQGKLKFVFDNSYSKVRWKAFGWSLTFENASPDAHYKLQTSKSRSDGHTYTVHKAVPQTVSTPYNVVWNAEESKSPISPLLRRQSKAVGADALGQNPATPLAQTQVTPQQLDRSPKAMQFHAIKELVETEKRYGGTLDAMFHAYHDPLLKVLSDAEVRSIFMNLVEIRNCQVCQRHAMLRILCGRHFCSWL